jgi:hypothetical protein
MPSRSATVVVRGSDRIRSRCKVGKRITEYGAVLAERRAERAKLLAQAEGEAEKARALRLKGGAANRAKALEHTAKARRLQADAFSPGSAGVSRCRPI